jgi:hypothetical protein
VAEYAERLASLWGKKFKHKGTEGRGRCREEIGFAGSGPLLVPLGDKNFDADYADFADFFLLRKIHH